jgi:chromosome segregation ATPase
MTRKLDKEHLEEIQSLREQFASISNILGSISIEEFSLQRQLEHVRSEQERFMQQYYELQEKEQQSIDKLRTHYGDGQINIADGTFTADSGLAK